jgi:hypothetical protein
LWRLGFSLASERERALPPVIPKAVFAEDLLFLPLSTSGHGFNRAAKPRFSVFRRRVLPFILFTPIFEGSLEGPPPGSSGHFDALQ